MKLAVQICADLEWQSIESTLGNRGKRLLDQPFGKYYQDKLGKHHAVVFQSGATKTRAAAACQFAIDNWHPAAVLNLGTCGGVAKDVSVGTLIMANRTVQYDVIEKFGKPSLKFKRGLETDIDLSWVDMGVESKRVRIGTIASADHDLDYEERLRLQPRRVLAADWESASIATVCRLNGVKCLIIRGVSDLPQGGGVRSAMDQERSYRRNAGLILTELFAIVTRMELS